MRPRLRLFLPELVKRAPCLSGVSLIALASINFSQQVIGLSVGWVKGCSLLEFPNCLGIFVLLFQADLTC